MRLYTFERDGQARIGAERDGRLIDLRAVAAARGDALADEMFGDMLALLRAGERGMNAAREALAFAAQGAAQEQWSYDLDAVRLLAPVPRPPKILCSGVNYRGHMEENPGAVLPETPGFFSKLPTTVIGHGQPIIHPSASQQVDYEVEFAVVIGRTARKVPEHEIMQYVAGYTILHDVSARDFQFRIPRDNNITLGKNFDTFAPMGPCLVTADEIPEPWNLRMRTLLNGTTMQDASTSDWVFPLPFLLSFLANIMTLEPGDVVTTGTPRGVGVFQQPPVYLKPGDTVVLEIERIGRLENQVVAETVFD